MSGYPYRWLTLWIALLAFLWLGACSPWPLGVNLLLAAIVAATGVAVAVWLTRRAHRQRAATAQVLAAVDGIMRALPADLPRHTPLILTIGDAQALACAWGEDDVRLTDAALWVRCAEPATLMQMADALKRWRGGQGPDAVAMLVALDEGEADPAAATREAAWRSALGAASRAVGYALPVAVAMQVRATCAAGEAAPWLGMSGGTTLRAGEASEALAPLLETWGHAPVADTYGTRTHAAAWLEAAVQWADAQWLPAWLARRVPWRVVALGATVVAGAPAARTPFRRYVAQITGLTALPAFGDAAAPGRCPLPDALVAGVPRQPVRRVGPRALAHALIALAAFFVAGTAASAWQNRTLATQLADHAARYRAIPAAHNAARVDALDTVKRDRDRLERYAQAGVPLRLGFGLYCGAPWVPILNRLIAGYQPPPTPPSMIELNSLSLFDSGSATLNPGSNRVLVAALEMIQAHPDKRVLVAGYTDSVGQAAANLRLSEARAAAVRDWLIEASGISPTRFAIQGYGQTRPKASNATPAGRAANRRVAITLIPDCRRDRDGSLTPGPPACS